MAHIYNIGEFSVKVKPDSQGFTWSGDKQCQHRNLTYDGTGEIITCDDCEKQVTAWWAFLRLMRQYKQTRERLDAQRAQLKADLARNLTHRAAIAVEDAWRKHKMVPTCPHCFKPILPGDRFGISGSKDKTVYAHELKPMEFRAGLVVVNQDITADGSD